MDKFKKLYEYLKKQKGKKILFLATSSYYEGREELPKSTTLALELQKLLDDCEFLDVSKLKIFHCHGNVSTKDGNVCGVKDALLKDDKKNPNKFIRCWVSFDNKEDELYKVANKIFESDIIIFFGPVRWGKMNATYTNLIERLTWLENRHTTLGEENLLKDKLAGIVIIGHNWNVDNAVKLEKNVLNFFGFKTSEQLSFGYQWSNDKDDETKSGYKQHYQEFFKVFDFKEILKETIIKFKNYFK